MSGRVLGRPLFALKIMPFHVWDLDPHLVHFWGPIRVNIPNGIKFGSAALAGLTVVTDRQTDRRTTLQRL